MSIELRYLTKYSDDCSRNHFCNLLWWLLRCRKWEEANTSCGCVALGIAGQCRWVTISSVFELLCLTVDLLCRSNKGKQPIFQSMTFFTLWKTCGFLSCSLPQSKSCSLCMFYSFWYCWGSWSTLKLWNDIKRSSLVF